MSDAEIGKSSDILRLFSAQITLNSIWQENPFKIQPYYGTPKIFVEKNFHSKKLSQKILWNSVKTIKI